MEISTGSDSSGFSLALEPAHDTLRSLTEYDFPGNVRELASIIERAVLLVPTELLQSSSLAREILLMKFSQSTFPGSAKILPFEEVERDIIAHALKVMDNDVTKAASALKIGRSTLYRKLQLYPLFESD